MGGRFITFEGPEGAGKTLQLDRLRDRLERTGVSVLKTREPGGTALGRELRALLLRPTEDPMHPTTELLLYVADRAQHLAERILPALERGETVLCDRFTDATIAYQCFGRGIDESVVRALHAVPPLDRRPDLTLLIDVDVATGLGRARARDAAGEVDEGRFEAEADAFHQRVRDGYLELARREPERIRVIDGTAAPDSVTRAIASAVAS